MAALSPKHLFLALFLNYQKLTVVRPAFRQVEVTLPDGTRCDCLTDTHAIEFDFGDGWAEAIGQSAYYSLQTKKKPGVVLILETTKDRKYWIRLNTTIEHFYLPTDTWSDGNASY